MPEDRKIDGGFETLFRMIVGQQISVKAANSVWLKLEKINANDPAKLLKLTENKLKSAGLSKQKINYSKITKRNDDKSRLQKVVNGQSSLT